MRESFVRYWDSDGIDVTIENTNGDALLIGLASRRMTILYVSWRHGAWKNKSFAFVPLEKNRRVSSDDAKIELD